MSKYGGNTIAERIMKRVLSGLFFALITVVLLALVILPIVNEKFAGVFGNTSESSIALTNETMNVEYAEEMGYSVTITGSATNESSKDVPRVTLQYKVFDEAGKEIGSAIAVVENIAMDKAVEYSAITLDYMQERPHSFKVSKILTM